MKVIKLHGNSQGDLGGILGGGFAADNISHIHDFKTVLSVSSVQNCVFCGPRGRRSKHGGGKLAQ